MKLTSLQLIGTRFRPGNMPPFLSYRLPRVGIITDGKQLKHKLIGENLKPRQLNAIS